MLADPAATLRQLAAFVGVELSAHLEDDTLRATSFDRMARCPAFVNVRPGSSKGGYGLGRAQLTAAVRPLRSTRAGASAFERAFADSTGVH